MTWNATAAERLFRLHVTESGSTSDVRLVVAGKLDRELESVYTAMLTAVDGGNPSRTGTLDVTILIQVYPHHQRLLSNMLHVNNSSAVLVIVWCYCT